MNEKEKTKRIRQSAAADSVKNDAPKKSAGKRPYTRRSSAPKKSTSAANTTAETTAAAAIRSTAPAKRRSTKAAKEVRKTPVRIIPLGGLHEIGKNMTVFECSNDMFILDCGLAFPDADMPGVDIVIPDFTYVERNRDKIRGVVITHGHEDHIGGLAYLLKKINVPVYATKLTIGLIEGKLKEQGLYGKVKLNVVEPKKTIKMGCMAVEFIKVNHSIPDAVGMAIHTPAGIIVHTGDFKVDYSPIDGKIIDLARFGELGSRGVLALMADSTNAERPGYTRTERTVGESLDKLFQKGDGKRINTAIELGYLDVPSGIIIDIETMNRYESERIVLITTGSQGEPMSALTRMAMNDHKKVNITPMDFIIISATPIPGNEKYVTRVVNELMKSGAEVVYEAMYEVHVSGHACQEELKLMLALTKPKFFIPVHGEYKHLKKHAGLALQMGIPKQNIIIGEIGNVIETDGTKMSITSQVPAGRVLVDGLGVGDVGSIVLRDRKHLAQDGLIIIVIGIERSSNIVVAGPDIISRGFVYVRESEELMVEARQLLTDTLNNCSAAELREWNTLKGKLRDSLSDYIYQKTKRSPMILPIIMET